MNVAISNLRYVEPTNTLIDMDVGGVFEGEVIPFTYNPADNAPVSKAVRALLASGSYQIAPYIPPP